MYVDYKHNISGTTASQMDRLNDLREKGVEVFLANGPTAPGIQHSKSLLVDDHYLVGSINWTSSSRSNHAMNVLIQLTERGLNAVMSRLALVKSVSTLLTIEKVVASQAHRDSRKLQRAKSEEPAKRFATAKRFSVARARSRDRTL